MYFAGECSLQATNLFYCISNLFYCISNLLYCITNLFLPTLKVRAMPRSCMMRYQELRRSMPPSSRARSSAMRHNYVIGASDLHTNHPANKMSKFADNT